MKFHIRPALLSTFLMFAHLSRSNAFSRSPAVVTGRINQALTSTFSTASAEKGPSPPKSKKNDVFIPRVLLKRNRQSKTFREGNQLIFTGSVEKTMGKPVMGDFVQIEVPTSADSKDSQTQLIGWGMYNPLSMYRVRILAHVNVQQDLAKRVKQLVSTSAIDENDDTDMDPSLPALTEVVLSRLQKAKATRQAMGLPSSATDTYRLVNGEGDGLSGLAADVVGNTVAVMSSAAWCEVHKDMIQNCLREVLSSDTEIIWKTTPSRLKQDGLDNGESDDAEAEDSSEIVIATENEVKYQTYPYKQGQKTGVYCDQRENRDYFAQSAKGKRVLDLCCYHGGFSLNAAKNGASHIIGVDSSQDAIDACTINAELNGISDETVQFVKADISNYLQDSEEQFDMIILDPPKLAPSVKSLEKASRKYHSLNRDAMKLIDEEKGGLLMTCTCSAAMTQKDGGNYFLQVVQKASLAAKRQITLLRVSSAAPCHTQDPASFPAGKYLTAAIFHVHPL